MSGKEVREYTNLTDPKDKKYGKGKEKIDDEDVTFHRMVAKMQEVAGERGGYLHGRGALDSDDLLYLKEQMEAEEDAERLLRRTEKRAFAAFKKAASLADSSPAAVPLPLRVEPKPKSGIRQQDLLKNIVEIRPKRHRVSSPSDGSKPSIVSSAQAGTNQQGVTEQKPEIPVTSSHRISSSSDGYQPAVASRTQAGINQKGVTELKPENPVTSIRRASSPFDGNQPSVVSSAQAGTNQKGVTEQKLNNPVTSLLGLAYESSEDEDEDD